jgi:hypothetical protein
MQYRNNTEYAAESQAALHQIIRAAERLCQWRREMRGEETDPVGAKQTKELQWSPDTATFEATASALDQLMVDIIAHARLFREEFARLALAEVAHLLTGEVISLHRNTDQRDAKARKWVAATLAAAVILQQADAQVWSEDPAQFKQQFGRFLITIMPTSGHFRQVGHDASTHVLRAHFETIRAAVDEETKATQA